MTQQGDATTITSKIMNKDSSADCAQIARLYRHFLREQISCGQSPSGAPIAPYLRTLLLMVEDTGEAVGFISVEVNTRSVELIYVERAYRRSGLARAAIEELRDTCPSAMTLKGPVTPAGRALAESVGVEVVGGDDPAYKESLDKSISLLAKHCRHKGGRPDRACQPCIKAWAYRASCAVISIFGDARAFTQLAMDEKTP